MTRAHARPIGAGRALGEPIDRLFACYAAVSGIAVLFALPSTTALLLAALHVAAIAAGLGWSPAAKAWRFLATRFPRAARLIGDWYPLLLVPALYGELAVLNAAVHGGRYFDDAIIAIEQAVFGGQPSLEWAAAAPNPVLSEVLHASYLSYYPIIYLPPLLLYAHGRWREFRINVFALMLTFFAHYIFFIYLPVQGPRYLYPAPGGPIAEGFFYQTAHAVLEAGSSRGAAFPSSHVGVAVAQTILASRFLPRLAPLLGLLTLGLALGAIYGGFHYATDVVAGAALGACAAAVAPGLFHTLEARRAHP